MTVLKVPEDQQEMTVLKVPLDQLDLMALKVPLDQLDLMVLKAPLDQLDLTVLKVPLDQLDLMVLKASRDPEVSSVPSSTCMQMSACMFPLGPPGPTAGGISYIRWGRTDCPATEGTMMIYSGRAAGTFFQTLGGGTQYLCLPDAPEFIATTPGVQNSRAYLHGAEYESRESPPALSNVLQHNVPCAVCYTTVRGEKIMIPAKTTCPSTWTREYYGYLMTETNFHSSRTTFECVDMNAEGIAGSGADTNGALFYFTETTCNGIDCANTDYAEGSELSCVVCTK